MFLKPFPILVYVQNTQVNKVFVLNMHAVVVSSPLLHKCFPRSSCICCYAMLPGTSQPSCSFPQSESSRAVEVFLNFLVLCQASYKDGCRKALRNCSLSFTYCILSISPCLFCPVGICVKPKHIDATKFVKIWIPGQIFAFQKQNFPICTKLGTGQCTKENGHPGQKQRQETHRYFAA